MHGLRENLRRIDRVKIVLRAAELAGDIDLATLGNDAFDLCRTQATQHVAHPLA